jgi:hypothetical protein
MSRAILGLLLLLVSALLLRPDEPEYDRQHTVKSANGNFAAEFFPDGSFGETGWGEVTATGGNKPLYSFKWYANEALVSNDGHYLVRFGRWAMDSKGHTDLAIAFYKDGVELKSYLVKDLVRDVSSVDESVSHYIWQATETKMPLGFSADEKRFTVVTTDKLAYEFDVATGEIAKVHTDPTAMSGRDRWAADNKSQYDLARQYIAKSKQLPQFDEAFTFSQLSAKRGSVYPADEDGEEWFADMTPRDPKLARTMVEQIFFIDAKTDQVKVSTTPDKLEHVLAELGQVPFVKRLMDIDPSNDYRLRAAGLYLHWDSKEVARIIKAFPADQPKPPPMDKWIYFIIDTKAEGAKQYLSFYHPQGTDWFVMTSIPLGEPLTPAEIAQIKSQKPYTNEVCPVINSQGRLQFVLSVPSAPFR